MTPQEIASKIDNLAHLKPDAPSSICGILDTEFPRMVEVGEEFGRALEDQLRYMGWENYLTHSYCSKATFESHLHKKGTGIKVSIISSVFFGTFTQIDVSGRRL
jgi:hypothetical protein